KDVTVLINESFIPVKLHIGESGDLVKEYEVVWTPTIVVAGADGTAYNASVGFLPPKEFLAQLGFGIAKVYFNRNKYAEAIKGFEQVVEQYPECDCTPEAMYWLGVSSYRLSGSADGMTAVWQELVEKYPDSLWAKKVSFIEGK
ncbi:MAG: tetratricopeptide repeat protein, partial [Planctomycetota bacterium]